MAWTAPRTWNTGELVTKTIMDTHIRDNFNAILPVGTLILRVAAYTDVETAVESRWLQCNGVAVSRTTYATLFNYLNSMSPALPFGTGDGSTTFNLPDMRGRTAYAEGEHADVDAMGDSEGSAIGSRKASHHHTVPGTSSFTGSGTAAIFAGSWQGEDGPATYSQTIGSGGGTIDTGAYLVVGSYFIKYTS